MRIYPQRKGMLSLVSCGSRLCISFQSSVYRSISSLAQNCSANGVTSSTTLRTTEPLSPVPLTVGADKFPYYCHYPLNRKTEWRSDEAKLLTLYTREDATLMLLNRDKCVVVDTRFVASSSPAPSSDLQVGDPPAARWQLVLMSPASATVQKIKLLTAQQRDAVSPEASSLLASSHEASATQAAVPKHSDVATDPQESVHLDMRDCIFLGVDVANRPYFAYELSDPNAALPLIQETQKAAEWQSARTLDLSPSEGALAATAVGVAQWSRAACFSSSSGEALVPCNGGFARKAPGSRRSVWPRIDPAVIMLVTAGSNNEWCLLGRKPDWVPGRYSALAGFVEVGEPLEMAVAREVEEESAVPVSLPSVRYVISQPWPFPRSLMIGFFCQAVCDDHEAGSTRKSGFELLHGEGRRAALDVGLKAEEVEEVLTPRLPKTHPQEDEMADVRWFHRDFVAASLSATSSATDVPAFRHVKAGSAEVQGSEGFHVPGRYSLANRLIKGWLSGASSNNVQPALDIPEVGVVAPLTATTAKRSIDDSSNAPSTTPPEKGSQHSGDALSSGLSAVGGWIGDLIPQVSLDVGVFKYVLMRLSDAQGRSKLLVWGDTRAGYHMDVFKTAKRMADPLGLHLEPLGGGRMQYIVNSSGTDHDDDIIHVPSSFASTSSAASTSTMSEPSLSTATSQLPTQSPPSNGSSCIIQSAPPGPADAATRNQRCLKIFGYSSAFGAAPHEVTAALVRKWHPFTNISTSYEGY
ncbi:hypothetical protein CEUSTIGMA_g2706.t1 [Chlamydomonas eustigma]|uniref:NAD(+) diphosphatase n=1 Tax=Chlamydomonas eustigma TaxID=1157962 RepID=A0A250WWR7_9CHLO|nr:hypothetical protein CEUSTIGMA_g2706.t1 [Chlamydomonas eustigma]|eukprot:GAX75261.1 hypothetical protein CEUSTIGMA_g2706.t1 [Chlamydomonas eustigma]